MKYIFVIGGIISGIGKGITASSIALLLKNNNYSVTAIKIDPYLNIDAGKMSPFEHGETYILNDGSEVDLDLGNYERFLDINLESQNNITSGKIYKSVIDKEQNNEYLGQTVQMIPHITDEIQLQILSIKNKEYDFCIVELGGTIGDMETNIFIEAIRRFSLKYECFFVFVSMIIDNGEQKTKPTQNAINQLRKNGIIPNMLIMRTKKYLKSSTLKKLSTYCGINKNMIISSIEVNHIRCVPHIFSMQNICNKIGKYFKLDCEDNYKCDDYFLTNYNYNYDITVFIAGKYNNGVDTYLSLIRAIEHACYSLNCKFKLKWLNLFDDLKYCNSSNKCVIIPGGFGNRHIDFKLKIANYCRINKIPCLGICLGMQVMICEYSHFFNIYWKSSEWSDIDGIDVFSKFDDNIMRKGLFSIDIVKNTYIYDIYNSDTIYERHRHKYYFNLKYRSFLENNNMILSSFSNNILESIELKNQFYIGVQYHPEYVSRINKPNPLFLNLIKSCY